MPIGPYPDFAACVAAQKKRGKSDDSAHKICGYLEHHARGGGKKMSAAEFEDVMTNAEELYPNDIQLSMDTAIQLAHYPWSKCIADRKAEGKSAKAAAAICGSIKAKNQ